ncbi:imidazole glycerol phosphate synthase subunit HisH [Chromobacterium violaceum]|uniref:imidazole glycerol phosphate synthase subunit HisH n=1 Tax=Chromobacterium violaceum TaxID=536 RepID=UPI0009DACC5E|nr:imidazole glycerol phosphate synthase subunit HisH [Chromobacterium violaceum]MBP4050364.1 imidazole glycerol phosphate synthase subunit HisH [Chromobacterium violaceum]OQS24923.1 imidazole glycerol phosphate synthase subunit HisH [Chromobacterium violaceum]
MKVAVIDYGMGNLHSVLKSLQAVNENGADIFLTRDPEAVVKADKVVFPGQGAMPDCMRELNRHGLAEAVRETTQSKPFFGICVGAQLLFEHSEEGDTAGLGLFPGKVVRFADDLVAGGARLKVPHMGWNQVYQTRSHPLFAGIADGERFYFVHSYHFAPADAALTLAESDYPQQFACIVGRGNIFATQFHTEKSHRAGLQMMKNFLAWDGNV